MKDDLPPSDRMRLSAWGWIAVAASIAAAWTLARVPYVGATYLVFVAVGVLVALPGGMSYQGDVDVYLSRTPGAQRGALPWPVDYGDLTRWRALRYTLRGVPGTFAYGLLSPAVVFLGAMADAGVIRSEAVERTLLCLSRRRVGRGAFQQGADGPRFR
jgi:hypothetical protein